MNRFRLALGVSLAFILCVFGTASRADDNGKAGSAQPTPLMLEDKEFQKDVDLLKLGDAIRTLDCQSVLDQAARLAAAERRLGRPHKTVPSQQLFPMLLRMIAETGDQKALQAVEARLSDLGRSDSREMVEQTRLLMSQSRRVDLGPGVQRGDVSAEAITLYGSLKEQIRVARVVGDPDVLQTLKDTAAKSQVLHPKQRAYLSRMAETSIASLEAKSDGTMLALSTLAGLPTRSAGTPKSN